MEVHARDLDADEPTAFREVLSSELPLLRARLTVLLVDPAELDAAMARMLPGSSSAASRGIASGSMSSPGSCSIPTAPTV